MCTLNLGSRPITSNDPLVESLSSNFDTSGWSVNFGQGGTAGVTAGPKAAPTLYSSPTQASQGATVIPANAGAISLDNGYGSLRTGAAANVASLPWVYILGGAAAIILLWKRA